MARRKSISADADTLRALGDTLGIEGSNFTDINNLRSSGLVSQVGRSKGKTIGNLVKAGGTQGTQQARLSIPELQAQIRSLQQTSPGVVEDAAKDFGLSFGEDGSVTSTKPAKATKAPAIPDNIEVATPEAAAPQQEVKKTDIRQTTEPSKLEAAISDLKRFLEHNLVNPVARALPQATEPAVGVSGGQVSARPAVPALLSDIEKAVSPITKPQSAEQKNIDSVVDALSKQLGIAPEVLKSREGVRKNLAGLGRIRTSRGEFEIAPDGSIQLIG